MILTFFYVIATSIQSRKILFLKAHLRKLFQGNVTNYPSIMFYNKTPLDSYTESPVDEYDDEAEFMTSGLCTNKNDARLGELLWYRGDMRLCTIYPQQKIDISTWLTYQYGRASFPLHTNNRSETSFQSENTIYILVEADLESYKPIAVTNVTKIEDYGYIVAWTAHKNIDIIIESDLDTVAKFLIAAMEGQCKINNGLLLKRIETVLVTEKPCIYNYFLFNPPDKRVVGMIEWEAHVEKLRLLTDKAKIAHGQCEALQVAELPGIVICPDNIASVEMVLKLPAASHETQGNGSKSQVSTPGSLSIAQREEKHLQSETNLVSDDSASLPSVPHSASKSLDSLDTVEEGSDSKKIKQQSLGDVQSTSKGSKSDPFRVKKNIRLIIPPKSSSTSSMAKVTAKLSNKNIKPPNVLIYADSIIALNNVKNVLEDSLGTDKYAIYALALEDTRTDTWMENAALVVVCGNVGSEIGSHIVEYILRGGKLLALCSDVLHILLPSFKTAEVRENELVHFSYGKWKHVRMMHHIFCYQASPIRTRFSQDHEDVKVASPNPPASANVKDKKGKLHSFDVKVLGTEETWHTPSILLASLPGGGGRVVFSQIHLEVDPMQYELEESKFNALKESNAARIEIFNDVLKAHLGIEVDSASQVPVTYTPAFFLGRYELKTEMLKRLKDVMQSNDTLKMTKLDVQFCRSSPSARPASSSYLPIMMHQCPENFSTIEYFENLSSKELGRLVIYSDVMTSSMDVLNGYQLQHGLAVISRQQTQGQGRGKNLWLSPKGCAMFTLQLHIPVNSVLGSRISIIQHVIAVAIITAVKSLPGYEDIYLRIKWPNDIYAGDEIKLGGTIVTTQITRTMNICNVGVGMNLFNKEPTCCINDIVNMYNETYRKKLKMISYEQYFAVVFNEIEKWLDIIQDGHMDAMFEAYYTYWMHTDAEVTVVSTSGTSRRVKILGIDEYGFLRVRSRKGKEFTVHPDGNSFDSLKGLIIPK